MKHILRILGSFVLVLALCLLTVSQAMAIVYIKIDSPSIRKFYLALPEVQIMPPASTQESAVLRDVLLQDLTITNLFNLMESRALPQQQVHVTEKNIDYTAWANAGAEFLLSTVVSIEAGAVVTEFRLFDVVQGTYITGKRYKGTANSMRLMAHRMADEVFYQLTGERGIFETKLAFVSNRTGNKEIYIADYDGHNIHAVTRNGSINMSPAWAPDGNSILFTCFRRRNPDLYQVHLATGRISLVSSETGLNAAPDWSPDGSRIALMMRGKGDSDIYVINKDGSNRQKLYGSWANEASPSWSPDGKQLAFVSDRSGTPQIYVLDVRTGGTRRLTYQGGYNSSPVWSPRGNSIAYVGRDGGGLHVYTIQADGTEVRKLTTVGSNESPSWAPNGRYLAYASRRGGKYDVCIVTENGAGPWKIGESDANETAPAWSPWLN
jgi:TolB protein